MKNQTSQTGKPPPPPKKRFFSYTNNRRDLKLGTRIPEMLCFTPIKTEPSRDSPARAISTGSDLGRPPCELVKPSDGISHVIHGTDSSLDIRLFAHIFGTVRV